jgi:hypothetical protein
VGFQGLRSCGGRRAKARRAFNARKGFKQFRGGDLAFSQREQSPLGPIVEAFCTLYEHEDRREEHDALLQRAIESSPSLDHGLQFGIRVARLGDERHLECVDGAGNVWIANVYSSTIVEYAHGGTTPIASLSDAGQYPYNCSVNKKSGDLAVGNIESTTGGAGSVTLYHGASGSGTNYPARKFFINFVAYDGGKLFVDGGSGSGAFALKSFRQGHFGPVTISRAGLNFAGGVQVAGSSLTVGDQSGPSGSPVIYQVSKSGAVTATITPLAARPPRPSRAASRIRLDRRSARNLDGPPSKGNRPVCCGPVSLLARKEFVAPN